MPCVAPWSVKPRAYIVAIASCGVALLLRLLMMYWFGDRAPFFPFVLAVLTTAWFGGFWPGLLATVLGAVIGNLFFIEPLRSSGTVALGGTMIVALYVIIGLAASLVCEALHAARRRVEEKQRELQQIQAALKEADRRKDEFLAILAHELRNPLAPLTHAIEIMRLVKHDSSQTAQIHDLMERQVRHMVRLVEDLLDINRITRGKLNLRREQVLLSDVFHAAVECVRPMIDGSRHELIISLPTEPVELEGDSIRLAQIFSNLLHNAAKYSDDGAHIWFSAQCEGKFVSVSVKDVGIGIAAEDLHHIFDRFSQVKSAQERSHGGLGIGLSLVKGMAELHGGSVEARSAGPGLGSEFIVRLPALSTVALPAEGNVPNDQGKTLPDGHRVLIVDDNQDSADTLAMMLRWQNYQIEVVNDGHAALRMAEQFRPRTILMDIGMPGLSGYDAARSIRQEPWGRAMQLIAVTGWGHDEDKRRATEAGFDHHLTKPADLSALTELLERAALATVTNKSLVT